MEIEQLSEKNLKNLIDLILELWPECDYNEEFISYQAFVDSENDVCYLAQVSGTYVGFIHVSIRTNYVEGANDLPIAYIEAIYVNPNHQRLRIGEFLVKMGVDWAKQKGCKQLGSDTEIYNSKGIDFHKKIGFEEVNRVVCFIKNI
jgi:aminoglycoside 6'-N-acetyltransferase I